MGEVSKLGKRIKLFRERAGLSQHGLAERAGMSRSAIAGVETGDRPSLSLENVIRISRALGVSIDYLVNSWDLEDEQTPALAR